MAHTCWGERSTIWYCCPFCHREGGSSSAHARQPRHGQKRDYVCSNPNPTRMHRRARNKQHHALRACSPRIVALLQVLTPPRACHVSPLLVIVCLFNPPPLHTFPAIPAKGDPLLVFPVCFGSEHNFGDFGTHMKMEWFEMC